MDQVHVVRHKVLVEGRTQRAVAREQTRRQSARIRKDVFGASRAKSARVVQHGSGPGAWGTVSEVGLVARTRSVMDCRIDGLAAELADAPEPAHTCCSGYGAMPSCGPGDPDRSPAPQQNRAMSENGEEAAS